MVTRDPATTIERLLCAAQEEFSAYGIAGARVDRIAEKAGCNKERIYGHFGSKEKLFEAVLHQALVKVAEEVALPDSCVGDYVGRVFDYHRANPQLLRLLLWEALSYGDQPLPDQEYRRELYGRKVDSLAAGRGMEAPSAEAGFLLIALLGLGAYSRALPTIGRLIFGEEFGDDATQDGLRQFLMEFARRAVA